MNHLARGIARRFAGRFRYLAVVVEDAPRGPVRAGIGATSASAVFGGWAFEFSAPTFQPEPSVSKVSTPVSGNPVFLPRGLVPECAVYLFEQRVHVKSLIRGRLLYVVHNQDFDWRFLRHQPDLFHEQEEATSSAFMPAGGVAA
jgi:hypothetical protein